VRQSTTRKYLYSFAHRSLALDNKHTLEKEQAIKLIRTIVTIGSQRKDSNHASSTGTVPLSERVVRAFIAVAEQPDDPFRSVAIQTLAEISEQWSLDQFRRLM
jgi:rapamycin-insensitive companion of mTOR